MPGSGSWYTIDRALIGWWFTMTTDGGERRGWRLTRAGAKRAVHRI